MTRASARPRSRHGKPSQTLAELQFESGYSYIMFEDTVNANPPDGKITATCAWRSCKCLRRHCSTRTCHAKVGKDTFSNLSSESPRFIGLADFAQTIEVAIRALTAVSDCPYRRFSIEQATTTSRGRARDR